MKIAIFKTVNIFFISLPLLVSCVSQPVKHKFSGGYPTGSLYLIDDQRSADDKVTAKLFKKKCEYVIGDDYLIPSPIMILEEKLRTNDDINLESKDVTVTTLRIKQCSNIPGSSSKGHTAIMSKDGAVLLGAIGLSTTHDVLRCLIVGHYKGKQFSAYSVEIFTENTYGENIEILIHDCTKTTVEEISKLYSKYQ